jgi:hypothetical protein
MDPLSNMAVCGEHDRRNRKGKVFRPMACDRKGDADFIDVEHLRLDLWAKRWPRREP